jgi:hypothetical protein
MACQAWIYIINTKKTSRCFLMDFSEEGVSVGVQVKCGCDGAGFDEIGER